ncbi:MAG: phospholipase C [Gemmataceae bacterium]
MPADNDPIQHVVVLMFENRSFDQMLGILQTVYPSLDGIDPNAPPRSNLDHEGNRIEQRETQETVVDPDPNHDLISVLTQIESPLPEPNDLTPSYSFVQRVGRFFAWIFRVALSYLPVRRRMVARMGLPVYQGNFAAVYSEQHPKTNVDQRQQVMGYFPRGFLPALHALALDFTICDHWFASVPGSTWPNRCYVHTGTSRGRASTPEKWQDFSALHLYDQATLYDRLNERNVSWKVYHDGLPQSLVLSHQQERQNKKRYQSMEDFKADAAGVATAFPQYAFIEPCYKAGGNDDHPPNDTMEAQRLLAMVYNSIRSNPDLWPSTLLVVIYDEHGGFFDHVCPPATVRPDRFRDDYRFDQLGVRVPALLISPWVRRGVFSETLDHTSLLRYLTDKWKLGPLGDRVAQATSIENAIVDVRRGDADTIAHIEVPKRMAAAAAVEPAQLNENQIALRELAHFLETKVRPQEAMVKRGAMMAVPPRQQLEIAEEQIRTFLES